MFLGSADLMPRNLDRRVEVLFPVESARLRETLLRDFLEVSLRDNVKARLLCADGHYERLQPRPQEAPLSAQERLLNARGRGSGGKI